MLSLIHALIYTAIEVRELPKILHYIKYGYLSMNYKGKGLEIKVT